MSFHGNIDKQLTIAIAQYDRGELVDAAQSCREILHVLPSEPAALHLLGLIALEFGDSEGSLEYLQKSVHYGPDDADAWNDLGNVLQLRGQIPEAQAAFQQAIQLAPEFSDAHSNLGYMLFCQGAFEDSLPHFRRAIALEPAFTLAYNNLGSALLEVHRWDEAIEAFHSALAADPHCTDACINLGHALRLGNRQQEAIAVLEHGLKLAPHRAELFLNLGGCHKDLDDFEAAESAYQQAIALQPDYAEAHWNLSLLMLASGDLARGWDEFEWRRKIPGLAPVVCSKEAPEWTGQVVDGKTVLLIAEQGIGDTLLYIRYAKTLRSLGARVVVTVPQNLLRILRRCEGVDQCISLREHFPRHDYFCYLLSLPRLLSPTLETLPAEIPYLEADPALVEKWRPRLRAFEGFKIGIVWQGNPKYTADRNRSIPLHHFQVLAQVPGVRLISLQKGHGSEQLSSARDRFPIADLGDEVDVGSGPFMDTAAILRNLDLVISSDTALVHLAGALGVPLWLPTSFVPDWRWLRARSDSPWYPTARLFRQTERGNWSTVFAQMAEELARIASPKR